MLVRRVLTLFFVGFSCLKQVPVRVMMATTIRPLIDIEEIPAVVPSAAVPLCGEVVMLWIGNWRFLVG